MATRRDRPRSTRPPHERYSPRATAVARVLASLIVLACLGRAAAHFAEEARRHPRFLVDAGAAIDEYVPSSTWPGAAAAVREHLSSLPQVSIFASDFEERLRQGALGSSWVSAVPRVERLYPNRVRMHLVLREPLAAVELDGMRYLVDAGGRVLDRVPELGAAELPPAVRRIRGAVPSAGMTPAEGYVFPDPEVLNALAVAVELRDLDPDSAAIVARAGIDGLQVRASAHVEGAHAGEVLLRLRGSNAVVRWGRPAGYRAGGKIENHYGLLEKPVATKVRHLGMVLDLYPGLRGVEEVRLDFDRAMVRVAGGGLESLPVEVTGG